MSGEIVAIFISSIFLGAGLVIPKFFPEASLLAAFFLIGLVIINITLMFAA